MKFNQGGGDLKVINGESLKNVDDFLYMRSWIDCCSKDVNVGTGKVLPRLPKLDIIWKSKVSDGLKIRCF